MIDTAFVPSPYADALASIDVRERTMNVLGSSTHYWEYGVPGAGVTLVFVHGFRGDHHGLEPVVAQLHGFHIIAPDLPGFGSSTPLANARHDIDGYARWLRGFVAGLDATDPVCVLGHSFGSIVVAATVAQRDAPDRLDPRAVVLVNPIAAPALEGPRGVFTQLAVFYYWLSSALPSPLGFALLRNRLIVRVMSMAMAKTRDRTLRRWIHDQHDRFFSAFDDRSVVLEAFRASVSHDVREYAAHIGQPTLLIAAANDDITPLSAQHELVRVFPDARLTVIDGVGHLIHYETPVAAAAALRDFLADLDAPAATERTS